MRRKGHAGEHRDTVRVTLAVITVCVHTVILFILSLFFSLTLMSWCDFPHKLCISIKLYMEINSNAENSIEKSIG